jgi:hypothetical protein
LAASLAWASDKQCPTSGDSTRFAVSQLSAAALALVRFKKDQPGADEHNVLISISESDKELKLAFSPDLTQAKSETLQPHASYCHFNAGTRAIEFVTVAIT